MARRAFHIPRSLSRILISMVGIVIPSYEGSNDEVVSGNVTFKLTSPSTTVSSIGVN
jgi:hypothetical protein